MPRATRCLAAVLLAALVLPVGVLAQKGADSARVRQAFMHRLERPRVPLDARAGATETVDGLVREKVTVASEAGVRVPLLLVRRPGLSGRRPAVVCLHGLGGKKEGMLAALTELAKRGYVGAALDARYHGDRAGDVQAAMVESFRTGKEHPYLFDTVWDTWRVLDYLQTRPDVDPERLGVMGVSLGGHTTWMVSADPRVKVAVPCISVCSWRWQLENEGYTQRVKNLSRAFEGVRQLMGEPTVSPKVVREAFRRWTPGVPETFDSQDLLSAFAPRPLLMLNGDSDPVAPLPGLKLADAQIEEAYRRAGAAGHVRLILAEHSGHTVTPAQQQAMYEWFDRWLKP